MHGGAGARNEIEENKVRLKDGFDDGHRPTARCIALACEAYSYKGPPSIVERPVLCPLTVKEGGTQNPLGSTAHPETTTTATPLNFDQDSRVA